MDDTILIILVILGVLAVWRAMYVAAMKARRLALMEKYQDEKIVTKIMGKYYWQGQTAEQLLDSLGRPEEIGRKVMNSKIREVWKYNKLGTNRYGLRITLENDVVIGWDKK